MAPPPQAVLVIACDRPAYLQRTLDALFRRLDPPDLPVIVSQDGAHGGVRGVVEGYGGRIVHLRYAAGAFAQARRALRDARLRLRGASCEHRGHRRVAEHYRWAFDRVFKEMGLESVAVLEDDLEIAPDFFSYLRAGARLMAEDPTIWTASAWNDNGRPGLIGDPQELHRSDFFPGLGWLMTGALWAELGPNWPECYWDDWMRQPRVRRGRVSIRPEVSRTYTFGAVGVSRGQNWTDFLRPTVLATEAVDFEALDIRYLRKDRYDAALRERVLRAELVTPELAAASKSTGEQKIVYHGPESFARLAAAFGLMPEFREGLPRTSYLGVVGFRLRGRRVFLVPLSYLVEARGRARASRGASLPSS